MADTTVFSADSHVVEPPDVWTSRVEPRFRDRAPHIQKNVGGFEGDFFVCEDLRPFPVSSFAVAGVDSRDYGTAMIKGYEGVRPGAWDPVERIKDQELDGVDAEVLYPTVGMATF